MDDYNQNVLVVPSHLPQKPFDANAPDGKSSDYTKEMFASQVDGKLYQHFQLAIDDTIGEIVENFVEYENLNETDAQVLEDKICSWDLDITISAREN